MKNAFSVDLEDWFCVHNFAHRITPGQWSNYPLRVPESTRALLALFKKYDTRVTFFVLGWIAERVPDLIREIAAAGHEIATHGYSHIIVKEVGPELFEADLRRSLLAIRGCTDAEVIGFRAPSFSVTPDKRWIFDILSSAGIRYDSSIYPVGFHPDYANSGNPLEIYRITDSIVEFPMSCFKWGKMVLPCSGGGYFRIFPYWYTAAGIRRCNKDGRPAVFYIHPWEIDPEQPRIIRLPPLKHLRHYINLDRTFDRLNRLLDEFEFDTVASVLHHHRFLS